jgi:FlaA1/EpsC-like NDP-sugar epimerase
LILVSGVLAFLGFTFMRYRMRIITGLSAHWINLRSQSSAVGERVLIVGAGEVGHLAAYLLRKAELGQAFTIIGMVDDAPRKQGARIGGLRVLGNTADIPRLARRHDVGLIIYAIENIQPAEKERILRLCRAAGVQTAILPDVLAALRAQLDLTGLDAAEVRHPEGPELPAADSPRLESWLVELDGLMQAQAWDAAHEQIQAMVASRRQEASARQQVGRV